MKRPALLRIKAYLDRVVNDDRLPIDIRLGAHTTRSAVKCELMSMDLWEEWAREDAAKAAVKEPAHA